MNLERQPKPQPEGVPERFMTSRHTSRVGDTTYNVYKLIEAAEDLPVETLSIALFDEKKEEAACWDDSKGQKIGPKQIIELARKYNNHWNAMITANPDWAKHIQKVRDADYTTYPLLVYGDNNVIDGMHRLTKAWLDEVQEIAIKRFPSLPAEAEIDHE